MARGKGCESIGFDLMKLDEEFYRFYADWIIKPHIFDTADLVDNREWLSLDSDMRMYIHFKDFNLYVPETVFKRDMLSLLGIQSILKQYVLDTSDTLMLKSFLKHTLMKSLSGFIFFYSDTKETSNTKTVVGVKGAMDKNGEPLPGLCPETLSVMDKIKSMTEELDCSVINPTVSDKDLKMQVIIARTEDAVSLPNVPCIITDIDIVNFRFKQYGAIFLKKKDSFVILPRNYAKKDVLEIEILLNHVASFFKSVDWEEDYATEMQEISDKYVPSSCVGVLRELELNSDFSLSNVIDKLRDRLDKSRETKLKREKMYKCLGMLIAMKHKCCEKCRYLDTNLI